MSERRCVHSSLGHEMLIANLQVQIRWLSQTVERFRVERDDLFEASMRTIEKEDWRELLRAR